MKNIKRSIWSFLLIGVFILTLSACQPISNNDKTRAEYENRMNYLLELIEEYSFYFDNEGITKEMLYEGILNGIVYSLSDPYSVYLNEEDFQAFLAQVNQNFAGVGVSMIQTGEYITVFEVLPNSPAEQGGILPGDVLVEINGESVVGLTTTEVGNKIKDVAGKLQSITVARGSLDTRTTYELTLAQISQPTVHNEVIQSNNQKIGYVEITSFSEKTFEEFSAAITKLNNEKVGSLILDVRGNPGGYLHVVKDMLDYLIDSNEPLLYVRSRNQELKPHHQNKYEKAVDYPVVILIDEYSASASEIFAAALNELNGYPLIGQTTYGKGTVQTTFYLNNERTVGVKLTTDNWLTPKQKWIQDVGVEPTDEVLGEILKNLSLLRYGLKVDLDTVNLEAIALQTFLSFKVGVIRTDGYVDEDTMDALISYQKSLQSKGNTIKTLGNLDFTTVYHINKDVLEMLKDSEYDEQLHYAIRLLSNN